MTWVAQITPWDDPAASLYRACWAPGLGAGSGRVAACGSNSTGTSNLLTTDDGGATWDDRGTPLGASSFIYDIAYAAAIGLFVAVGIDAFTSPAYSTSADGVTWAAPSNPFGASFLWAIASNPLGDAFVVLDNAGGIWTSTDGLAWTLQLGPFNNTGTSVRYFDALARWYGSAGNGSVAAFGFAEAADLTFWDSINTPTAGISQTDSGYHVASGKLFISGGDGVGTIVASTTDLGVFPTWDTEPGPFDGAGGSVRFADCGTFLAAIGQATAGGCVLGQTAGGGTWGTDPTPLDGGTGSDILYVPELGGAFLFGQTAGGTIVAFGMPTGYVPVPPPVPSYARAYGIRISLSDDGVEQVSELSLSPDGFAT